MNCMFWTVYLIETVKLQKGNKDLKQQTNKKNNKHGLVFYLAYFRCSDKYDHIHLEQERQILI